MKRLVGEAADNIQQTLYRLLLQADRDRVMRFEEALFESNRFIAIHDVNTIGRIQIADMNPSIGNS